MRLPRFNLTIYDKLENGSAGLNQRTDPIFIAPSETTIRWQNSIPGGFGALNVGIQQRRNQRGGTLPRPVSAIDYQCHVVLRAGSAIVFVGQIVQIRRGSGKLPSGFIAEGYGISAMDDGKLANTSSAPVATGLILRQAFATLAPYLTISASRYQAPTLLSSFDQFNDQTLTEIIQRVTTEGNQDGVHWDWGYWEQGLELQPRSVPSRPQYDLPWNPDVMDWDENGRKLYNRVAVATPSGTVVADGTNTFPYRARIYAIDGGQITLTGADSYARAAANFLSQPQAGISLRTALTEPLRGWDGTERAPWLARPGEWALIDGDGPHILTRTECDASSQSFSAVFGDYWTDEIDLFRDMRQSIQAFRRQVNPYTWAPQR